MGYQIKKVVLASEYKLKSPTLRNSMLHFQCAIVCASCYKGLLTIDPAGGGGGRVRSNGRIAGFAGGGGAGGRAEASTWTKLWHHVLKLEIELSRSSNVFPSKTNFIRGHGSSSAVQNIRSLYQGKEQIKHPRTEFS